MHEMNVPENELVYIDSVNENETKCAMKNSTDSNFKIVEMLYCWEYKVLLQAVILAPDEGGVETSWKSAGGIDAGKVIGNAGRRCW
ncbi:hypothetical protein TNCV_1852301 [Trichonephila clavipes]|nr:hypothetical protein TNCV_1852301 [Trichonephila clavipes]